MTTFNKDFAHNAPTKPQATLKPLEDTVKRTQGNLESFMLLNATGARRFEIVSKLGGQV